MTLVAICLAIL